MNIQYLIVDDEPLAHKVIEKYSAALPTLTKAGNCYDAIEAMQLLSQQSVDLLFLDIQMPTLKGLAFLRTLSNPPAVIITTAYKEYALEGYELDVVDYLLKPFAFERFLKAVNKVLQAKATPLIAAEVPPMQSHIFIKTDKQHVQVALEDICYLEAYGSYVKVYTKDKMLLTYDKLSAFEERLPSQQFMRVHKSYIVAILQIKRVEGNQLFIQKEVIPVGGNYRAMIRELVR